MASNDFLSFAGGSGANVLSQSDYAALTAILTNGFAGGVAQSAQVNKVLRQASIMSAVLAQFTVDLTGKNAVDDGTTAALLASLKAAVSAQSVGVVGMERNAQVVVGAASNTLTYTADELIVESSLGGQRYCLANVNNTLDITKTGAGGMDTGASPSGGFIGVYEIFNPVAQTRALLGVNASSAVVPQVYGGTNMPAGYTASALASIWPTYGNGQLMIGSQNGRRVSFPARNIITTMAMSASYVLFVPPTLPRNAKSVTGSMSVSNNTAGQSVAFTVGSDANATGGVSVGQTIPVANGAASANFDIDLSVPLNFYYSASTSGGNATVTANAASYRF